MRGSPIMAPNLAFYPFSPRSPECEKSPFFSQLLTKKGASDRVSMRKEDREKWIKENLYLLTFY